MPTASQSTRNFKGDHLSVRMLGAMGDGSGDDSGGIQKCINWAYANGYRYVLMPAGTYVIAHTIWVPSGISLVGRGGRSRATTIKRANGMYVDAIATGIWDGASRGIYNGTPNIQDGGSVFGPAAPGSDISIKGIYIDGNVANAGQPPMEPDPGRAQYRGSNLVFNYVDGVHLDDVWSDHAPNDGCFIYACRRVQISNCEFSDAGNLLDPYGNPTRNAVTFAGTFSGSAQDSAIDALQANNIICHHNYNGFTIQARTGYPIPGTSVEGGQISVSNLITYHHANYGLLLEYTPGEVSNVPMKNVVVSGWISTNDGWKATGDIGLACAVQGVENVVLSNVTIRNAPGSAILIAGGQQITLENIAIQGWNQAGPTNTARSAVLVYSPSGLIRHCDIRGMQISGDGRTSSSSSVLVVTGVDTLTLGAIHVEGGKYSAATDSGFGVSVAANQIMATGISASLADNAGMRVFANPARALSISDSVFFNNGQNATANFRSGLVLDFPITRGSVTNCGGFDTQDTHTQSYGFWFPNADTRRLTWSNLYGSGNVGGVVGALLSTGTPQVNLDASGPDAYLDIQAGPAQSRSLLALRADDGSAFLQVDQNHVLAMGTDSPSTYSDASVVVKGKTAMVCAAFSPGDPPVLTANIGSWEGAALYPNGLMRLQSTRIEGSNAPPDGEGLETEYDAVLHKGYIHSMNRSTITPGTLAISHTGGRTLIGTDTDDGSTHVQIEGSAKLLALSGSGTRTVTVASDGLLSSAPLLSGGDYYTKSEVDTLLAGKSSSTHVHAHTHTHADPVAGVTSAPNVTNTGTPI